MSESRLSQLRFDISEKVRLHPQQSGIGTLLELDLFPDVEVKDEGKHLKIQGYLRLTGAYLGEGDQEKTEKKEDLSYVIPVEITIPTNRADMENISAEVETFDYNVLSPFELQVEAILTIDGLLPEEVEETKVAHTGEEKKEVINKEEQPSFSAQPIAVDEEMKSAPEESKEFNEYSEAPNVHVLKEKDQHDTDRPELKYEKEPSSVEYLNDIWTKKREVASVSNEEEEFKQDSFAMEKEMDPESELCEEESEKAKGKDKAWINWLVERKEESFTGMRMVIVHREDSIDSISEKYEVSSSNLMRLNQLESDDLTEGQIVYVPSKRQKTS